MIHLIITKFFALLFVNIKINYIALDKENELQDFYFK